MRKALIVCIGCTWLVWWGHYFVGVCDGVHNMLIFGHKKRGHILAFVWKKETFWQLSPAIEFRTRGQLGGIIFRSSRPRFVQIQTFSLQHHRRPLMENKYKSKCFGCTIRSKVIEKKCKFASKQSQPTWKPQRATQDAMITKKGGKCLCSISMKSFLFLILLTVFQFLI